MSSPSLVIENTLPGVTVLINQAQVARPIVRQPTSTFFAVGYSIWGPVAAARATTSWADFIRQFGGLDPNSHLADAIYAFYKMGGRTAVISRVVGAAAAKATATLKDRSGTALVETATVVGTITLAGNAAVVVTAAGMTGSPKTFQVPVLLGDTASVVAGKIRAALAADAAVTALFSVGGAGALVVLTKLAPFAANDATLNISVDNGTCTGLTTAATSANTTAGVAALNTLKIDAKYPSTRVDIKYTIEAGTAANTVKLTARSVLLNRKEIHDDILIDAASIDRVNQDSKLVDLTNLASATAAPNNLPVLTPATLLTGGSDDFAGLAAADYIGVDGGAGARTGLQVFNDETLDGLGGTGQVAIPGLTTNAVHAALNTHASTFHRLALIDPPLGSDAQDVIAIRQLYGSWYMAMYWPWVECLDFAGSGLNKFYPPSGIVAGACAKVDRQIGTHKAPANEVVPFALGVEKANGQPQTDDGTRELLNDKDICVITPLPEQGVKIYGARVMTGDPRVQMVHQIRMLNLFYYSAKIGYAWAPFSVVDGQGRLFRDLRASGVAFLKPYWDVGGLFGKTPEDAFIVIADESNNPPEELEAQRVHVQWGVHLSPTAEIVIVNIDNVPLFQGLDVLA